MEKKNALATVLGWTDFTLSGQQKILFQKFCETSCLEHDSRQLIDLKTKAPLAAEAVSFVALRGERYDGARFIPAVLDKVAVVVVPAERKKEPLFQNFSMAVQAKLLFVERLSQRLNLLARAFYGYPERSLKLIGVTGTNGKTTITYLLERLYRALGAKVGVIGTIETRFPGCRQPNTNTTLPFLTLQRYLAAMRRAGVTVVALELSSHGLALERAAGLELDSALFSNFSLDHLDFHHTLANYFSAKFSIFSLLAKSPKLNKLAVLSLETLRAEKIETRLKKTFFSGGTAPFTIAVCEAKKKNFPASLFPRWRFSFSLSPAPPSAASNSSAAGAIPRSIYSLKQIKTEDEEEAPLMPLSPLPPLAVKTTALGKFNAENFSLALLEVFLSHAQTASCFDPPRPPAKLPLTPTQLQALLSFSVPGRLEFCGTPRFNIFIDYAHTPAALEHTLLTLRQHFPNKQLLCLFGCGGGRDAAKRPQMGALAAHWADFTYLTSDNPRSEVPEKIIGEIKAGFIKAWRPAQRKNSSQSSPPLKVIVNRKAAIFAAISALNRLFEAESVLLIAGKGHEQYQLVGERRVVFDEKKIVREAISAALSQAT